MQFISTRKRALHRFVSMLLICLILLLSLPISAAASSEASEAVSEKIGGLPEYLDYSKIVSSPTHSLAIYNNLLYSWGTNSRHQLPGVSARETAKPVLTSSSNSLRIRDIAAAENRTYVLTTNGVLHAYGVEPATGKSYPSSGQIVAYGVSQVSSIGNFAIFLKTDGTVWTMGKNDKGQLGYGLTGSLEHPIKTSLSGIAKVAAGNDFSLALAHDGTLYGWGNNDKWQLGLSTPVYDTDATTLAIEDLDEPPTDPTPAPEPITYEPDKETLSPKQITTGVKDISAGAEHCLILTEDNKLWACGDNSKGQLGINRTASDLPFASMALVEVNVKHMAAGAYHNYMVNKNGEHMLWGSNEQGQLGLPDALMKISPVKLKQNFIYLVPTYNCTFAYTDGDNIWSFGESANNITGKNNGRSSTVPAEVFTFDFKWKFMATGNDDNIWPELSNVPMNGISKAFVGGYPDGTFRSSKSITRAEFLKMAVSALTNYDPKVYYDNPLFNDVDEDAWYANIVAFAYQEGLASGYENHLFKPEATITRAEASQIVYNMRTYPMGTKSFSDVKSDSWMQPAISSMATTGILDGYADGRFKPDNNITRAEAIKIIATTAGFSPTQEEQKYLKNTFAIPFSDVTKNSWHAAYLLRAVGDIL